MDGGYSVKNSSKMMFYFQIIDHDVTDEIKYAVKKKKEDRWQRTWSRKERHAKYKYIIVFILMVLKNIVIIFLNSLVGFSNCVIERHNICINYV